MQVIEAAKEAAFVFEEFVRRSVFDNFAVVKNNYPVHIFKCGKTMGDGDDGFVLHNVLQRLLDGGKVEGGHWQTEIHDFMSLPLMVRPGTVLPLGAHDDRPDYDYLDGVELHVYQLADGESETVEIPDTKGNVAATFTVTMKDGQAQVETDSTKPYTVVVHQ